MLEALKQEVYEANLLLPKYNLVTFTWGNVSGIDRESGLVVIKPSGVEYVEMKVEDMVVVDLMGNVVEGTLKPSSDTETHLELYRHFKNIQSVVHTHSRWATIYSQAGLGITPFGTTHGDYFGGEIPCTRDMTEAEIKGDYELETGKVIVERFEGLNPDEIPSVLVKNHHFKNIQSVVHTHSRWATIYSQAGLGITPFGTTHGDYFGGEIPCTRDMTEAEIKGDYELETGKVIVERFEGLNPDEIPSVLVKNHGPFSWGTSPKNAVHNAVVLEEVAMMAWHTTLLSKESKPMPEQLLNKHFYRKHGPTAYYGQTK